MALRQQVRFGCLDGSSTSDIGVSESGWNARRCANTCVLDVLMAPALEKVVRLRVVGTRGIAPT